MSSDRVERTEIDVDGGTAAFLREGEGPTVVLVHGLGLSAGVWRPHLPHLARRGFSAIAPDLPGFGETPGPALGQRVEESADWLERLADTLGITRAAWVGHSISCQSLLRLAARRPDLAAALVLAAPTGVGESGGRRATRQLFRLGRDGLRERLPVVAGVVRRYFSAPLSTLGTWLRARHHRPEVDAARVRCPALIVLGDLDPVVTEPFAERLASILPRGELARLAGAGHAVAIDPPHAFAELVGGFLASHRAAML